MGFVRTQDFARSKFVAPVRRAASSLIPAAQRIEAALAEVRRVRSLQKRGSKSVIAAAVLPSACAGLARQDFVAALHIQALSFADVAEPVLTFAEEPTA